MRWNWLVFFVLLGVSIRAYAFRKMVVPQDTNLYSRPTIMSIENRQLTVGRRVVIAEHSYRGFRHILIERPGSGANSKAIKGRLAWILESDYQSWLHRQRRNDRWALWAGPIYSYVYEAPRSVTTSVNDSYAFSQFTGGALYYALGGEYRESGRMSWRLGFVQRSMDVSGSTVEQSTDYTSEYDIKQTFVGLIGGFRFTPRGWKHWKFDATAEFSQGEHVNITAISGPAVNNSLIKTATYFVLSGGFDYAYRLSSNWSLLPAVRMGVVASTNPFILTLESEIDLAYSL